MPPKCPTCNTEHAKSSPLPGEKLVCAACDETFVVRADGESVPTAPGTAKAPKEAPAPRRKGRTKDEPASRGRMTGAPRPRRDDSDGPRRRRAPTNWPPRMAVIVGAGAVLLVLVIGGIALFLAPMWKRGAAPPDEGSADSQMTFGVPPFDEPANPYKAGTQVRLRELRTVSLPASGYIQLIHAPKHDLLFARNPNEIWTFDLRANAALGIRTATERFTDFGLAPDQSVLFAADFGGEAIGYKKPLRPSRIHRFDLAARQWADAAAPNIAFRLEAVDADRFLLLTSDQHVDLTLNRWGSGQTVRELARIGTNCGGDIEYDPRTGRVYHGNTGVSSQEITVSAVDGDRLKRVGETGAYGTAQGRGGSVALARDGSRFYYGKLQVKADSVRENLNTFPDVIVAASRDIAFTGLAYYRANEGTWLGDFEFRTTHEPKTDPSGKSNLPAAIHVSPDGMSVWVIDRDQNVARQYALEGDK
jgi:hypothetical protein